MLEIYSKNELADKELLVRLKEQEVIKRKYDFLVINTKLKKKLLKIKEKTLEIKRLSDDWQDLYQQFYLRGKLTSWEILSSYNNFSLFLQRRLKSYKEKLENEIEVLSKQSRSSESQFRLLEEQSSVLKNQIKEIIQAVNTINNQLQVEQYICFAKQNKGKNILCPATNE